jgi:predicted CopG family antitoxin
MSTKTITIDSDAYRLLAEQKRAGESFSRLIKRRLRSAHTAEALLEALHHGTLSEDAIDATERLVAERAETTRPPPTWDEA